MRTEESDTEEPDTEEPDGAEPARPATKPGQRRRRLRRWLVCGALAGVLVVGGLVLARNRLVGPFVLARVQPQLEAALGGRLSVETWSGSWWSDLRLEGVSFERTAASGPLVRLTGGEVHARYDLLGLLGGDLGALAALELSAEELVFAPRSPLPGARRSPQAADRGADVFSLPATLPALDLGVERLAVALDAGSTARAGEGFEATAAAGALALRGVSLTAADDAVALDADALDLGTLVPEAPAGALAARLRWNAADIALERLSFAGALEAGPGRADLREIGHGAVTWELAASLTPWGEGATARPGPAALRSSGVFDPREREKLRLEFTTDGLELARVSPLLPQVVPPLSGVVAGEGRWRADLDALATSPAELTLSSEGVRVDGLETGVVRVDARLEDGMLLVPTLDVEQPAGSVSVRELRMPLTSASPTALLAAAEGSASLRIGDLPALLAAFDEATADAVRAAPPHVLALELDLAGNALSLTAGSAVADGGELRVARGEVRLPEPGALGEDERWWEALALDVDLAADVTDLAVLGRLFGREDLGGRASATVQLEGTPLALRGTVEAEGEALVVAGTDLGRVELTADARPGSLRITRAWVEASTLSLEGRAEFLYRDAEAGLPHRLRDAQLELVVPALEDLPLPLELAGAASAEVRLDGPLERLDGSFGLTLADVVVAGRAVPRLAAEGRIAAGDLLIDSLRGRLEDVEVEAGGAVALGPDQEVLAVRVDTLELAREEGTGGRVTLSLAAPATLAREPDGATLDALELVGSAGRLVLRARLQGPLDAPAFLQGDLRLEGAAEADGEEGSRFDLGALLGSLLPEAVVDASVGGTLAVEWRPDAAPLERLRGSADLRAAGVLLEAEAPAAELVAKAELRGDVLELSEVVLEADGLASASLWGSLPLAPGTDSLLAEGPLALTFEATTGFASWPDALSRSLFGDALDVHGGLQLEGELAGTWRIPTGSASLRAVGLEFLDRATEQGRIATAPGEAPESFDLDVRVDLTEEGATLDGSARLASFGSARVEGAFERGLDLAALARGDSADLLATPTRARLELSAPDLSWFGGRLPAVRRSEGRASADVALEGTLASPTLTGSASLEDASLRLATAFPALQDVDAAVRFEGAEVVVEDVTGALGGAAFRLGGRVTALRDPAGPRLDLALQGDNLLLFRDATTRVRANTDVRVSGPLSAPRVEGSVELTEGRYGRRFELLRGLSGEASAPSASQGLDLAIARVGPLARLELALEISASEPFEVHSNLLSGGLRPRLSVSGTGEVPLLAGSIFLEPTLVSLPSGKLRIEAGRIEFDPSDPFVPKLELSGGMRLKGYDVQVVVSGDYNDPSIRLASTPPLPNQDLLVLFLTGQLPEGSAGDRSRGAAESVAVYLAQDYISRWLAGPGDPDEESILERIELSIGDDVTRSGALTTEVSYLLTDRADGPGSEQSLVGERDVYDKINFGYAFRFLFQ